MKVDTNRSLVRSSWPFAIPLAALGLYLLTAYRLPGWIDSGELAAVAHTLGVPHPPGSPLYALIARCALLLLPGSFFPLAFLSAISTCAGLYALFNSSHFRAGRHSLLIGALIAILLAVAPSVWKQAIINEVYALHFLMICLFLAIWLRHDFPRRIPLLAYIAGLDLAVHQTGIFLVPFMLEALWSGRQQVWVWLSSVGLALLGASSYLYLPIRSAAEPLLDWGAPRHWGTFWRHVSGWQYSSYFQIESAEQLSQSFEEFARIMWHNFPFVILLVALFGVFAAWNRNRRFFWTSLIAFLGCTVFSVIFSGPDMEAFLLMAVLVTALWAGQGLMRLREISGKLQAVVVVIMIGSLAVLLPSHVRDLDRHEFRVATDWVHDAAETIEPGGTIVTAVWDFYSPWLYLRVVEDFRPDLFVLNVNLLKRSWYPDFIRRVAPEKYARAKPELDRLAPLVDLFESGRPYDPFEIEQAYADAIYALTLGQPGVVHVDGIVDRRYLRGAREVPWGLLPRLFRDGEPVPPLPPWPDFRNNPATTQFTDGRTSANLQTYLIARRARELYLSRYQKTRQ